MTDDISTEEPSISRLQFARLRSDFELLEALLGKYCVVESLPCCLLDYPDQNKNNDH